MSVVVVVVIRGEMGRGVLGRGGISVGDPKTGISSPSLTRSSTFFLFSPAPPPRPTLFPTTAPKTTNTSAPKTPKVPPPPPPSPPLTPHRAVHHPIPGVLPTLMFSPVPPTPTSSPGPDQGSADSGGAGRPLHGIPLSTPTPQEDSGEEASPSPPPPPPPLCSSTRFPTKHLRSAAPFLHPPPSFPSFPTAPSPSVPEP